MRLTTGALAAALILSAGAASAADDIMTAFYANTLDIDVQGLWHGKLQINADKSYVMVGDDGTVKGTWEIKDGQFCLNAKDPASDVPTCSPWAERKLGDSWENTDSNGIAAMLKLVEGRQ